MKQLKLLPTPVALERLDEGSLFAYGTTLALKSEYRSSSGAPECFCVGTGEAFWGGTNNAADLNNLKVTPVEIVEADEPTSEEPEEAIIQTVKSKLYINRGLMIAEIAAQKEWVAVDVITIEGNPVNWLVVYTKQ